MPNFNTVLHIANFLHQLSLCCNRLVHWVFDFVRSQLYSNSLSVFFSFFHYHCYQYLYFGTLPSVLWRCWLGGRMGIWPVKNWVVGCWHGYLSGTRCRLALHHLMPLPITVSCFSKIQIGFAYLVPAHLGSPGKKAIKRLCVCVCVCMCYFGTSSPG